MASRVTTYYYYYIHFPCSPSHYDDVHSLKKFYFTKPSFLEVSETCDSNRICDNHGGQYIAKQKYEDSFSVDTAKDLKKVEKYLKNSKQNYKYLKK